MLIQCPSCATQAKLPDSKEGAKVRCPQCSFVYVAREGGTGARRTPRSRSTTMPIAIGAGLVALLFVLIFAMKGGDSAPPAVIDEPVVVAPPPPADSTGWDSEPVKLARQIHDDAFGLKEFNLVRHIDVPRAWAVQQARMAAAEDAAQDATEEESAPEIPDVSAFMAFDPHERSVLQAELLAELQMQGNDNLVAAWKPVDGSVVAETDKHATVRVQLAPRDPELGVALRWIEWRMVRADDRWKAYSWERWISPEELRAERAARAPSKQRKELSDGSIVYEAEPRPIPYPDDVPQAERDRIDALIVKLIDLDRRDQFQVRAELTEIGKNAIPPLLTCMYQLIEKGLVTDEDATRVVQVDRALYDLTDFITTWKPHEALGATKERQESGLRQWFSWYDRKFRRFEGPAEQPDMLEELLAPKNEEEARELERYRRQHEEAERDAARMKAKDS
jgi:predicted Zn finger-like uncharacterized protein